jgi:uncharacterized OsmC-like protein
MRLKRRLNYSAEANWNHQSGGTAKVDGFNIDFDTPHEHGGNETSPCPDQLFMTSLAGCIINTFNYYRVMLDAETQDIKVNVTSDIILTKTSGYRVTGIKIDLRVWSDEENHILNTKCAERAIEYCHLTKSIEKAIPIETSIEVYLG